MSTRCIQLALPLPEGEAPPEFRIFTAGITDTSVGSYTFDEVAAALVMQAFALQGNDLVIDYEHKSLDPYAPPGAGIAAGWFRPEVRAGELWAANVQWTDAAREQLRRREWRYFSPAAIKDETGRIVELVNLALTNMPATKRMTPLVASKSVETPSMSFAAIAAALGLPSTATEKDITDAARTLGERASSGATLETALLEATGTDTTDNALGVVAGWKAGAEQVTELGRRVTELEAEGERRERETLVASHPKKFSPALKEWAKTQTLAALRGFVGSAPDIAAFSREVHAEPEITVTSYTGKPWAQLSPREKHDLYTQNRPLYDALKASAN